jgi:hypothetical protein
MRHSHGLRAAVGINTGILIGSAYQGGFFAGFISHTANGVATHGLIVAPAASGYNGKATLEWKTSNTSTAGTSSDFNGSVNSANMNNASHPAAQYCEGLTIGGYSDWYLPARYELEIAYDNLKPEGTSNRTDMGINPYSVPPRTVNRTAGAPAQTFVAAFQFGEAEAFAGGGGAASSHYSSTEYSAIYAWCVNFTDGNSGGNEKALPPGFFGHYVRAFRKFAV